MSQASMSLVGMAVALFLYGIYFNLFLTSTYLFIKHSKYGTPLYRSMIFLLGCALFLAATANCILITIRVFQGFISFEDGTAALAFFSDQGRLVQPPAEVAQNAVYIIAMLFSDAMVIFRLWVVSKRSKLIVTLPILTLIGLAVCGLVSAKREKSLKSISLLVTITPTFVFTLVTNVYCTGIYSFIFMSGEVQADVKRRGHFLENIPHLQELGPYPCTRNKSPECGTLHVRPNPSYVPLPLKFTLRRAWALVYTVLHEVHSEAQFAFILALAPLAGIANSLIQVRMALGKAIEPPATASATSTAPLRFVAGRREMGHEELEMKPQTLEGSHHVQHRV
ncbi:hypothetical protein C8R44DRAFT_725205 [Mycena epipterygia]|nr:hypothetical protein C8R44DRAFT_725205 [Mycena epipterygia]